MKNNGIKWKLINSLVNTNTQRAVGSETLRKETGVYW